MTDTTRSRFETLTVEQRVRYVHQLAAEGWGVAAIARGTLLSVEAVEELLATRRPVLTLRRKP